jgi:hypothetical protein
MSHSNKLLKLCAVASSLLLAIGFVSYQAGALDSWNGSQTEANDAPVESDQIMVGSKSAAVFVPAEEEATPANADSPFDPPVEPVALDQTIMSGSKVLLPTNILKELVQSEDYGAQPISKSDSSSDGDQ